MTHTATNQNPVATQWTESHAVHDRVRMPRAPRCRAAGLLLALIVLALAAAAHAEGGTPQGTSLQGVSHQSTRAQGSHTGYRAGDQLIGWLLAREAERAILLEITCSRDDILDAPIHELDPSASLNLQLHPGAITGARWRAVVCVPIVMSGCATVSCPRNPGPSQK